MDNAIIKFPAILDNVRPRKDGSWSIIINTQELSLKEQMMLLQHNQKFGWFLFKDDEKEFKDDDVPKESSKFNEGKPPSQRLRAVIYREWEQYGKAKNPDFEAYYRAEMEKEIQERKNKLI